MNAIALPSQDNSPDAGKVRGRKSSLPTSAAKLATTQKENCTWTVPE
ncbi:hypothetical protein [Microseira wollei]|uniref:Transposase n=1 Tax=Microseira wollei NIES-4236 TaxID=2530354 RepID=A0AAV3XN22_9CYAN|nr:hypothetical protein [Microseira wollei]GET42176.1 hypothetical protein MiSe_69900 [Microseira wollei NIES-4236]